ncbi:MAG: FecCD family ABC transporter permease [Candidatus Bathyarchaeia archaeon]
MMGTATFSTLALSALLILLIGMNVVVGTYKITPLQVYEALINAVYPVFELPHDVTLVVLHLRLPETLAAALLGASLASAGAVLQLVLRNNLASTYTLGVSAAAGFGAALVIVLGFGGYVIKNYLPVVTTPYLVIVSAFVFSSIAAVLIYALAYVKGASPNVIILAGVAVMFLFSMGTSMLQYFAGNPDATHAVAMWMLGNLTNVRLEYIPYMALSIIPIIYYVLMSKRIDAMGLGDDVAHSLGVNVGRLRLSLTLFAAFQAATVISFVGIVGFVDLVTPNIARLIVGRDTAKLTVTSALMGADLTLVADIISKSLVPPYIIPIGIILSMIGAPYLLLMVILRGSGYGD